MHDTPSPSVPDFTQWPSFPFEGDLRVKQLDEPVAVEPPRKGEGLRECIACNAPDDAYIWVGERWRVRAMDRPTGLPMVLILESRSHLDLGDLPNLLAAELGVMTVRLERAIRSLDGVARVHVNRWGDGSAHLHMWFLARPYGRLQLRGTFLSLWDSILPPISESQWRENLAHVAAWLAEFGGRPLAEPPRIQWQTPSSIAAQSSAEAAAAAAEDAVSVIESEEETPLPLPNYGATPDLPTPPPAPAVAEDAASGNAQAEPPGNRTRGDDGALGDDLGPETDRDSGQPTEAATHPRSPAGNPGTDPATSGPDDPTVEAARTTTTDDPTGTGDHTGGTVTPDPVRR
ncbi:hypothetical protein ACWCHM_28620 [Micromonospora sp. SCSIO 07396]